MDNTSEEEYNKKLSNNLIQYLLNIINGNNVTTHDVKSIDYEVESITTKLNIIWIFFGEYDESSKAGGSYIGESCNSFYELENTTDKLIKKAKFDKNLRIPFINTFKNLERDGISKTNENYLIKDFGNFSTKETCQTCNGKCKITCNSCGGNGKHRCNSCCGTGNSTQYRYNTYTKRQESYSTSCSNCNGRGNKTCSSCSGTGKVRCNNCSGHGFFIITRHIVAKTKAIFFIKTNSALINEELQLYLNKKDLLFLNESIYFEPNNQKANIEEDDEEIFTYYGDSVILKQKFSIKSKEYICYAFSNNYYPFIKPYIFDDLLSTEISFILEHYSNKKELTKKEAFNSFNTLNKYAVVDCSFKEIAKKKNDVVCDTAFIVEESAHGFISKESSSLLSNHINKVIEKISPNHSPLISIFGLIFLTIFGFIFTEFSIEQKGFDVLLESIFTFLVWSFITLCFVIPINLVVILFKRQKIPKEYRQKVRFLDTLKLFFKRASFILIFMCSLGLLANNGYIPKVNGKIQYKLYASIINECIILKIKGYDICEKINLFENNYKLPITKNKIF